MAEGIRRPPSNSRAETDPGPSLSTWPRLGTHWRSSSWRVRSWPYTLQLLSRYLARPLGLGGLAQSWVAGAGMGSAGALVSGGRGMVVQGGGRGCGRNRRARKCSLLAPQMGQVPATL